MKIILIGTGNVATILGKKITMAGYIICQVYGRNPQHAEKLAKELSAQPCSSWQEIDPSADLYIIAISDKALYELDGKLSLGNKLVVHTAGSVSMDILKTVSLNYGVLYPLQSLRKELDPLTEIPLLTDANNNDNKQVILSFASKLSAQVAQADDTERMKLHVAAVVASNFTNHFYALAQEYCKKENLDFSLLYPLIEETAHRIRFFPPGGMQTGPAARNDTVTINRHIQLLQPHPALRDIYILLTNSIREKDNFAP